jgi:hypothetical protein
MYTAIINNRKYKASTKDEAVNAAIRGEGTEVLGSWGQRLQSQVITREGYVCDQVPNIWHESQLGENPSSAHYENGAPRTRPFCRSWLYELSYSYENPSPLSDGGDICQTLMVQVLEASSVSEAV